MATTRMSAVRSASVSEADRGVALGNVIEIPSVSLMGRARAGPTARAYGAWRMAKSAGMRKVHRSAPDYAFPPGTWGRSGRSGGGLSGVLARPRVASASAVQALKGLGGKSGMIQSGDATVAVLDASGTVCALLRRACPDIAMRRLSRRLPPGGTTALIVFAVYGPTDWTRLARCARSTP